MAGDTTEGIQDAFKISFKYYKSRVPKPDYSEVIDFERCSTTTAGSTAPTASSSSTIVGTYENDIFESVPTRTFSTSNHTDLLEESCYLPTVSCVRLKECSTQSSGNMTDSVSAMFGLKPPKLWNVYKHSHLPGFTFICNPFKNDISRWYWIRQCLFEYHKPPNICNLDALDDSRVYNLWSDFMQSMNNGGILRKSQFFKLRWVTLGYQYNWNTKLYYKEQKSEFPKDLKRLTKYISQCLGYRYYNAEAGIVNYYHLDSTLAGHTDHSEYDMDSPLFSISFGCDAIFLIGGSCKTVKPVPMFLRSGDIVVMAGESRLAYHAVPKILPSTRDCVPPIELHSQLSKQVSDYSDEDDTFMMELTSLDTYGSMTNSASVVADGTSATDTASEDTGNMYEHAHGDISEVDWSFEDVGDTSKSNDVSQDVSNTATASERTAHILEMGCLSGVVGDTPVTVCASQCASDTRTDTASEDPPATDSASGNVGEIKKMDSSASVAAAELQNRWMALYMQQSRININVRQVLKEGQNFPDNST